MTQMTPEEARAALQKRRGGKQGVPPENPPGEQETPGPQPDEVPAHLQDPAAPQQPMASEQGGGNYDPEKREADPEGGIEPEVYAATELGRLAGFLSSRYPGVWEPGDSAVDVAIRLLSAKPTEFKTCPESYCNKAEGHTDEHGWVNRG